MDLIFELLKRLIIKLTSLRNIKIYNVSLIQVLDLWTCLECLLFSVALVLGFPIAQFSSISLDLTIDKYAFY